MTNAPLYVMCNTIKNVMSSAAEAETGGIYMATQRACPLRVALAELGHPQPARGTPIYNDNSTATGILNSEMRQKLSKAFDMRFYWVKDRIQQSQFQLIWRKGITNMADYFTKHHPPWHHKKMRYRYMHKHPEASGRGCVSIALMASPRAYPLLQWRAISSCHPVRVPPSGVTNLPPMHPSQADRPLWSSISCSVHYKRSS